MKYKNEHIPALDEVLAWVKQTSLILNIELKYVAFDYVSYEEQIVKLIEDYHMMGRVVISSFNHPALKKVNTLNSNIECAII